jgi:TonB-dependent starch-binding outer membrane protein SusC
MKKQINNCNKISSLKTKMKMSLFLFLLINLTFAKSLSQDKITMNIESGTVFEVIDEIESKTDYKFIYITNVYDFEKKISISVIDQSIKLVLDMIFDNKLEYEVLGKKVFLREKAISIPLKTSVLSQTEQQNEISGIVVDKNGTPLPGASVLEKGTNNGTVTDFNGNFSLTVSNENPILAVSYIGFTPIEIAADGQSTINVILQEDTTGLDEIVVTGYGSSAKKDVTGAISSVKGEVFKNQPVSGLDKALQGRIAGLQVVRNGGAPGSSPKLRIRGTGTVNNSDPLYVVDGVPTSSIDGINPNNIESVEVLKDASASAIYGTRAANGVVIVTTRKGKSGKMQVNFEMYTGFSNLMKKLDVLDASTLAEIKRERYTNDGIPADPIWNDPQYQTQRTNWQDELFETGITNNFDLSISGGSEKSTYLLAMGYYDEKGIVNKANADRLNLRVNSSHKITNWLKVGHNMGLSTRTSTGFNTTSAQSGLIFSAIRFHPGLPVQYPNGEWGSSQISGQFGDINNPLYEVDIADNDNRYTRLLTNLTPEVSITKDLKLKANFAIDVSINNSRSFNPQILDQIRQRSQNSASRSYNEDYSFLMEYFLDYNKSFGDHKVGFVGGYTQQTFDFQGYNAVANNLPDEDPSQRFLSNGTAAITTEYRNNDGLRSVFGRANYAFKNKYLLTATVRSDESSKFAEGNRKGVFPAFSLGWRVSDEDFFNVSFINALKLTGGWGELGNQNIDRNQFLARIARNSRYSFGSNGSNAVVGANQISFSNPNVTWETVRMTNVGADASFLDYRLTSTLNYFIKDTDDMLLSPPAIGTQGRNPSPFLNVGEVRNKGFEIELNWQDQKGELSYSIGANAAFISNEVISLVEGSFLASRLYGRPAQELSRTYVGSPIATFYGWKADGLFQTQAEVDSHAIQSGAVPGDVRFVDINNDNVIDDKDRGIIGSPHPKMTYGINSNFSYKGFDLTMFFMGVTGVDILNADRMQGLDASYPFNLYSEITSRWTGQGTSNTIPRVSTLRTNLNHRTSDMFIESGDFLRLKNLTIGYTLPTAVVENMSLSLLRLYLSGQNVFTITDYSGLDPELGLTQGNLQQNVDFAQFPQPRTFLLGVNIGF